MPVSIDRRTPADTPYHARRPLAFCRLDLSPCPPPMGAWYGCSSLWVCTPNGAGTEVLRYSRRLGGGWMPKHTDAAGRRPSWEPAQPRVSPRRKEKDAVQLSGGIPKGALPLGRTFGDFKQKRLSRREQPGWTGARASAGPQGGPQTSPSRKEAGRREQARRDIACVRKVTPAERPAARRRRNLVVAKFALLRFRPKTAKTSPAPLLLLSPPKPPRWVSAGAPKKGLPAPPAAFSPAARSPEWAGR